MYICIDPFNHPSCPPGANDSGGGEDGTSAEGQVGRRRSLVRRWESQQKGRLDKPKIGI